MLCFTRLTFIFGYFKKTRQERGSSIVGKKIMEGWVGLGEIQSGSTFSCSSSKPDETPRVLCLLGWFFGTIYLLLLRIIISIGNSMICSDIWHKYHEWYFKIVIRNFMSRWAREIWDNFEISRVVFMPNMTYKSYYYLFILLPAKGL